MKTQIMMKKKFHSNDQAKLKIVCDDLCDNIELLLETLDIKYILRSKMATMACPIHDGDNASALNIYTEGDTYRGNWKCRTHNCEKIFKGSIIGFVRGVISNRKYKCQKDGDDTCSFNEALDFCLSLINKDLKNIKISKTDRDKKNFTNIVSNLQTNHSSKVVNKVSREKVRSTLSIPCQYFVDRGFSKEILDKYDVGLCDNPNKEMFNRGVVPIYDNDYQYLVGCTGRSIFDKCPKCKSHHKNIDNCPIESDLWKHPKWKHNFDFKSQNHLYNFWFAKEHILKSGTAIIVESPGNVWRLEENNIHNSVGIFGSSLSDRQKIILDSSGAMNLVILTDNDEAGKKAAIQIKQKCQNTYRVFILNITKSDVAEMNSSDIDSEIKSYLENIK